MTPTLWKVVKNARRAPEVLRCIVETPQWAEVGAAYLGIFRPRYPFLLRLRSGEQITVEELTDLKAFWQIFLRTVYRVDPRDRVIVDLGANIGIFTLYAALRAPQAKIFAVEPFPSTFRRLTATVHNHGLDARVTCLNLAATGSNGIRHMPDALLPSQRRSLAAAGGSGDPTSTQVAGRSLEAILEETRLRQIDLLKIDIEGSEYEVLLSTSERILGRIQRLAMEYHGDSQPYTKGQLFDHLRGAGFMPSRDICDAQGYGITEMVRAK